MAPKKFVLVGHAGFYNRGCEAIVRTTTQMLREQFPGCEIALASYDAENDRHHPASKGIELLDNRAGRWSRTWFSWQMRKLMMQPVTCVDAVPYPVRRAVRGADAVLQIGGDNFTSDYGLSTNSLLLGLNELALAENVPLIFWGVSVGPFDSPELEQAVMAHFRHAALITVRETVTRDYLREKGIIDNVVMVADPAMLLEPETFDVSSFWPVAEHVLAVNISPLACRYRVSGDLDFGQVLVRAIVDEVLTWDDWGVLLVPHVIKPPDNDDHAFMAAAIASMRQSPRVGIAPSDLDARQLKHLISECDMLIAARTHATIAGFSSGIPTISLAYSRKAHGINLDLYGHKQWLLDIRDVETPEETLALIREAVSERTSLASQLRQRVPKMRQSARHGATALAEVLEARIA